MQVYFLTVMGNVLQRICIEGRLYLMVLCGGRKFWLVSENQWDSCKYHYFLSSEYNGI